MTFQKYNEMNIDLWLLKSFNIPFIIWIAAYKIF